ncbi:YncE family protein [Mycobacterium sp.]|uniref:YncE family protein n=1 Tax=Mycobacterium sp. TaxID=1785 RepID=UPI002BDD0CB9|nr:YncE family protein [Mycobacterium sp.]HME46645.1 YncE family protein [Mycobacterium sp.]
MNLANDVMSARALTSTQGDLLLDAGADFRFAELGNLAVSRGPIGDVAVHPDGHTLVATNYGDNSVAVIDADTLALRALGILDGEAVATAAAGGRVYVATTSPSYDAVSVIDVDTETIVATYPLDLSITALAVSGDGRRIFVGRSGRAGSDLATVDTATGAVSAIGLAVAPGVVLDALRVGPDGARLYAALSDAYGSDLCVVDVAASRVLSTVRIGSPIRDLAVSPDGGTAYVLVCHPRHGAWLDVVDTRTGRVVTTVEIGGFPTQMTLSPDGTRAYVVDRRDVLVICTVAEEIVGTITAGALPSCVAAGPDGGRLYIADYAGGVTMVGIAPAKTMPLFQAMAMQWPTMPEVRELEPAAV